MTRFVDLHKWWSSDRKDNYSTTHPQWIGSDGQVRSFGYGFAGIEGRIVSPDVSYPPSGTQPLYGWWSERREDNHTTTDPSWAGEPGARRDPDNYSFSRLEGYAFSRPFAGTVPLYKWYSDSRKDHHTTTLPSWLPDEDEEQPPDYRSYRREGYILPPDGTLSRGDPRFVGYRPAYISGSRPLLVVLLEYADQRLPNDNAFYDNLVFGPGYPNIVDYFAEISGRRFAWTRAGLVRVTLSQPRSQVPLLDEVGFPRLIAEQGFNYAAFDRNRDGIVDSSELCVLRFVATGPGSSNCRGQTRSMPSVRVGGVELRLSSSNCDQDGDISLFAHELFHQLGFVEEIYGPGTALNYRASMFAGTSCKNQGDGGPVHLDPWLKMQAGWMEPRVVPITRAGGVALIASAQGASPAPLVFYDPRRGSGELFIVEYRTPATGDFPSGSYDAKVLGQGVAVWYVQRASEGGAVQFDWPPPVIPVPGGSMFADYLIGPSGPAAGPFWTAEDGEFGLNWDDGEDSGLRLQVGPLHSTKPNVAVQWRHASQPFLPRIDRVLPAQVPDAETYRMVLTIDGVFPVKGRLQAQLQNINDPSIQFQLADIDEGYSPYRLITSSDQMVLPGVYDLTVTIEATGARSNGAVVEILPAPKWLEPVLHMMMS